MPTTSCCGFTIPNDSPRSGLRSRVVTVLLPLALGAVTQVAAADPAASAVKPAAATKAVTTPATTPATKPTGKAEAAGIIVLDGKAPPIQPAKPAKGADVSTGIGLGGCAACDKTPTPGPKKPAATAPDAAPAAK